MIKGNKQLLLANRKALWCLLNPVFDDINNLIGLINAGWTLWVTVGRSLILRGQTSICNKYHDILFSPTTNVSALLIQSTVDELHAPQVRGGCYRNVWRTSRTDRDAVSGAAS